MQGWGAAKIPFLLETATLALLGLVALRVLHFSYDRNRVKPWLSYLCGPSAVSDRSPAVSVTACTCNAGAGHSLPAPGFNELRFVNGHPDLIRMRALTPNIFFKKQRPTHYCKKKSYDAIISNGGCEIHLVCKTIMSNNFFHRLWFLINKVRGNEWNIFTVLELRGWGQRNREAVFKI